LFCAEIVPGIERSRSETEDEEDEEEASEKKQEIFQDAKDHSTVTDFARFLG
jgi:hypothetical protein